jgi:peptidoglycan-associated lipoprotein
VPVESRNPTGTAAGSGTGSSSAAAAGTGQSTVTTVDLQRGTDPAAAVGRIVYFDFDSYVIKDDYKALVESHARALAANRGKRITVEGHTDERGGSEYNLALGQKRAEAVARSLTLLGASADQVEPVSFGKERPAVQGSDEAAWAKNRRAELKDR